MERQLFYAGTVTSLLLVGVAAVVLTGRSFLAGIIAATGFLLLKYTERRSRMEGRTREMKKVLSLAAPLFETVLLAAVLVTGKVPRPLTAAVIGGVYILEAFRLQLFRSIQLERKNVLGRDFRLGIATAIMLAYGLNPYYAFYGSLLLAGVTAYDLAHLGLRVYRSR